MQSCWVDAAVARDLVLALPFKGRVGWGWCWLVVACCRDNRLTSLCGLSAIHGRQLLSFACPKESNQRKGAPSDPRPRLRRGFATGGRVRPTGHPWPVVRIGAIPRAARVRSTRLFRPPSAATQREPEEQSERGMKKTRRVAYIRCRIYPVLLRQGLPRSALPGFPLGRGEQVEEIAARSAGDREGAFFLGYFLLGKQKKVTGRQDGGRKTQGRESAYRESPGRR